MKLHLEVQRFPDAQVSTGRFPSEEAVIEAAIEEMRSWDEAELDDATIDAINMAEEQGDRGEGIELGQFRANMEQRFKRAG